MQARFAWSGPAKARDAKLGKQGEQLQQLGDLRDGEFIQVEWRWLLAIEAKRRWAGRRQGGIEARKVGAGDTEWQQGSRLGVLR